MNNKIIVDPAQEIIYMRDMSDMIDFKSINKKFNSIKFINNELNEISYKLDFFDDSKFLNIKRAIELECKNYLNECYNIKHLYDDIVITNSWGNLTRSNQGHHKHIHPLSVVSGIIFLNDNIDNLNLHFTLKNKSSPIPYFIEQDKERDVSLKEILEMFGHDATNLNNLKNYLIIFLSNLRHFVTTIQETDVPRKTISFNTFWKGRVGRDNGPLASLTFDKLTITPHHNI